MKLYMALTAAVVTAAPIAALGAPADSLMYAGSPPFAYMGPKDGPAKPAEWAELPSRAQVLSLQKAIPPWSSVKFNCIAGADGALNDCVTIRSDFKASAEPEDDEAKVRALLPSFRVVQIGAGGDRTAGFVVSLLLSPLPNGDLAPIAVVMAPRLIRTPTSEQFLRSFPKAAQRMGVEGHATMHCLIGDEGRLTNCAVSEETPSGMGFGQAALSLAPQFRAEPRWKGVGINIPLIWKIAR